MRSKRVRDKSSCAHRFCFRYKKKLAELEPKLRIAETDTVKFQSQLEMMTQEKERLQNELKVGKFNVSAGFF